MKPNTEKTPKELFDEAVERKILQEREIKRAAMEMKESYQHWLWNYLEIDEVGE